MKEKKEFKETRVGKFLNSQGKDILGTVVGTVGDVFGVGILSSVGDKIRGSNSLTETQKETALELLELDKIEMQEVTKKWALDMNSDSWLSKNVRPIGLLWMFFCVSLFALLDAISSEITFSAAWIGLFSSTLITMVVAYYGSRGYEKIKQIKNK